MNAYAFNFVCAIGILAIGCGVVLALAYAEHEEHKYGRGSLAPSPLAIGAIWMTAFTAMLVMVACVGSLFV